MAVVKLRTALAAGVVFFVAAQSANAASLITEAFLANMTPNVAFLVQSSRVAAAASTRTDVRAYAQGELTEATKVAAAIETARTTAVASAAPATTALGTSGGLLTGRSVAIEPGAFLGQAANGRTPMGPKDLDQLTKLSGREFVDTFWLKQLDALSQLRADYENYAENGDDPALVALAKRELPQVRRRLAMLSKI